MDVDCGDGLASYLEGEDPTDVLDEEVEKWALDLFLGGTDV